MEYENTEVSIFVDDSADMNEAPKFHAHGESQEVTVVNVDNNATSGANNGLQWLPAHLIAIDIIAMNRVMKVVELVLRFLT